MYIVRKTTLQLWQLASNSCEEKINQIVVSPFISTKELGPIYPRIRSHPLNLSKGKVLIYFKPPIPCLSLFGGPVLGVYSILRKTGERMVAGIGGDTVVGGGGGSRGPVFGGFTV